MHAVAEDVCMNLKDVLKVYIMIAGVDFQINIV